ncbi:hypothetical protein [Deinococcus altitudinis]|uniref:hypothetical protein n=1 Tax=Deinococcus altitudinis TaxID=468914 RepID=UPI003891E3BF
MPHAQLPDAPLTPRAWKTTGRVPLGPLSPFVIGLWWLFGGFDAPTDSGLDPARWRAVKTGTSETGHGRRDMVRSAGRWLQTERTGCEKVRAILGPPDSSGPEADTWDVSRFTQYVFCTDGDTLVATFPGGRASSRTESY